MRNSVGYFLMLGILGCGGSNPGAADAPKNIDGPNVIVDSNVDAMEPPLTLNNDEGGEIRLEWIQKGSNTTARATAFFYKSETPPTNALPSFPGCVDFTTRPATAWPLAQGAITPLDVGDVIIHTTDGSGNAIDTELLRDSCGIGGTSGGSAACPALSGSNGSDDYDYLGRPHSLWWKRPPNFTATDGNIFPADQDYNVILTGSTEWPAQVFSGSTGTGPFMPSTWTPSTPAAGSGATFTCTRDGSGNIMACDDYVLGFTADTSTNVPTGYEINTAIGFTAPTFTVSGAPAGTTTPIVLCQFDGTPTTVTIPGASVAIIAQYGTGSMSRQHLSHHIQELTDGSPRATSARKRIDMLTVWCFNDPWTAP